MKIISNCPLCEEKSLHVIEEDGIGTQQCINCGYGTTSNFIGTKEESENFRKLTDEMQSWAKEENGYIWIPSIMALPVGMVYPVNIKKEMKWAFAPMVEIPKEERKNFPNPSVPGKFYDKKVDTDNVTLYDIFLEGMSRVNELLKQKQFRDGNPLMDNSE